ncbi:MAG: hypothetical protein A2Y94_05710 [Caldithrix sp. RBG_13_44_9]|nr:MAG: hypothetical protein A2Y94_05710 [Caldithrix sp. RBG_13_44_9]
MFQSLEITVFKETFIYVGTIFVLVHFQKVFDGGRRVIMKRITKIDLTKISISKILLKRRLSNLSVNRRSGKFRLPVSTIIGKITGEFN